MEFRIIVNGPIYIEATASSEDERKEIVKGIQYTLKDMSGWVTPIEEPQPEPRKADAPVLATDKQKQFMDKLKIQYDEYTTMVEASDRIQSWKKAHGYEI